MNCEKKVFETILLGKNRAFEINRENSETKHQKRKLRAYVCDKCKKIHLSSMPLNMYNKFIQDNNLRIKKREENFIIKETKYYEIKYATGNLY